MDSHEVSRLVEKKQRYSYLIKSAYDEINQIYHELGAKFGQLYPHYSKDDDYAIAEVDFWLGEVACNYKGKNYNLSFKLFELNNKLRDIKAFDLNESQVAEIYNMLCLLCKDVYGYSFEIIEDTSLSIDELIDKLKTLTDNIVDVYKTNYHLPHKKLGESIQKLYVLIDFALHEDDYYDTEWKHNGLRNLREEYLYVQSVMYDCISIYRKKIDTIDEQLEEIRINKRR